MAAGSPLVSSLIQRIQQSQLESFDEKWKADREAIKQQRKARNPEELNMTELLEARIGKMDEIVPEKKKPSRKEIGPNEQPPNGPAGEVPPPPLGDE